MLKSYEAIYENGQVTWLTDQPNLTTARIIVTVIEEPLARPRRSAPATIAGKAKTLGDLVSPIVTEDDWECLR
ncbi:hypothetical protein [Nodosilinea sp. E11]|uniref:hypothetical protein n=1 Tax=Nodosilinea sp. E11 TaxID=3037479 RepID=UPI00293521B6|nr:hypothetical protein [Nodosilinea sp. E11]WOD37310.1 hypothetical protein RRF56_02205 [Nodosilinea sp. E11]